MAGRQARPLTPAERDSLGEGLVSACRPLLAELGGNGGAVPQGSTVATHVRQILRRAGDDIVGTLHALLPWEHAARTLITQLAGSAADWAVDMLPQLAQALSGLRGLMARAWRQAGFKIRALTGELGGQLMGLLGKAFEWLKDKAGSAAAAAALRGLLQADDVIRAADKLIADHPDKVGRAMRACEEVDEHHQRRRRAVPLLNRALPACALIHPAGLGVQVSIGAMLLIYSVWLAHDHVDSDVLPELRLPKNPGLRTKIREALNAP